MTALKTKVDFGRRRVRAHDKPALVNAVFERVAARYDLMNDAMSMGVHRLWKRHFVKKIRVSPDTRLLDVAGGTGDIAFRLLARGAAHVTVCDPSADMMRVGQARALDRGLARRLTWVQGAAETLPFADHSFDVVTISFGLRNTTDRLQALREMRRVLTPSGQFFCLEFSQVHLPVLDTLYAAFSDTVIPQLGKKIAGDEAAYRYLADSIATFPTQEQLADMMATAGFDNVRWSNLSGGIAALHTGWKP